MFRKAFWTTFNRHANRLPSWLKRCYLDYLNKRSLNLNSPDFDSLRDFVVHELNTMSSDYAQAFFKSDEKDGLRDTTGMTKNVKVCQVVHGVRAVARRRPSLALDFHVRISSSQTLCTCQVANIKV